MSVRGLLILCIFLLAFFPVVAQTPIPSVPDELIDSAVALSLDARVDSDTEAVALWQQKTEALTLYGKPVSLRLEALNVKLLISLTPYRGSDGAIILVAQNQVWATDENKTVMYHSTINSMRVLKGQTLTMYPLGRSREKKGTMVLAITVLPYRETTEFSSQNVGGETRK